MALPRSPVTCHVLDSSFGKPAEDIGVFLEKFNFDTSAFDMLGKGTTNEQGRCETLLDPNHQLKPGLYKLTFQTGDYFVATKRDSFYPVIDITFHIAKDEHYHIPLLLSPWSYTTYRGS
ncbi:5-hydroxyisourate hydrolase [Cantharellus anzutake]|uniref:5-hydroxyisourate hydrolase n=1 Tax=Cantharellus anzutake TaxID=1750568 RepID=UPI0019081A4E|nr:5-hydroxyisourate hydrolase [Cantharellus anzutake]XP_038917202.1 5-hydroxyisourate hydrolase [Cantharellus anzutake]KAF8308353.1 5-hydroxyisourate hydrolase [Cantharellus anzutake]KAF8333049.1 5-hydroxyisourate hydrolase [Cantharellus anzutake]